MLKKPNFYLCDKWDKAILMKEKLRLERLEKKYAQLMKKSFELSLKNPEKGEECHRKAGRIFEEIQSLTKNNHLSI